MELSREHFEARFSPRIPRYGASSIDRVQFEPSALGHFVGEQCECSIAEEDQAGDVKRAHIHPTGLGIHKFNIYLSMKNRTADVAVTSKINGRLGERKLKHR